MMKKLISLVNPGVGETRANPCLPASMFSKEDLPTFDRPMKANSGSDSSGHESRSGALRSKMADEMFIIASNRSIAAKRLHRYYQFWRSPAGAAWGTSETAGMVGRVPLVRDQRNLAVTFADADDRILSPIVAEPKRRMTCAKPLLPIPIRNGLRQKRPVDF